MRLKVVIVVIVLTSILTGCGKSITSAYINEYCKFNIDVNRYDVVDDGDVVKVSSVDSYVSAIVRYYEHSTLDYMEMVRILKESYSRVGAVSNVNEDVKNGYVEFDVTTKTGSLTTVLGKILDGSDGDVLTCVATLSSSADSNYKKDFREFVNTIDFVEDLDKE